MRSPLLKRILDLVGAAVGLAILWPPMLVIGLLIRGTMRAPSVFRQERPGLHGKPFVVYKFRTMVDLRDERGNLLPDEARLTPFGRFLRKTSLDELPELLNVLKGEMSIVGPRPLRMEYLDRYTPEQARRHEERPGITGWAQINGRNAITWEEKLALDVWYVENQSLRLDMKIIALTFPKVLKAEDIRQPGHATAEEFRGTKTVQTYKPPFH